MGSRNLKTAVLILCAATTLSDINASYQHNAREAQKISDAVDDSKNLTSDVGKIVKTAKEMGIEKATLIRAEDENVIVVEINGEEKYV